MQSSEIRQKYLDFFKEKGHKIIPSASLIPENDPSSLFITAGMQPLVPYLLGEKHPMGTRLVDVQKCIRTGDIEDVGDNRHLTFFEMLGNWSLGDYFKEDAIKWSLEFLTSKKEGLGLDPKRLYVTIFKGENGIPRDEESIKWWKENFIKHGIKTKVAETDEIINDSIRIVPLGVKDNFWIAGNTGPCGGDTEMFYDVKPGEGKISGKFSDYVNSGRLIEIWNNVFMEFNKTSDGQYKKLPKPNVDTGMGLERTTVVMQGKDNVYETDIFEHILAQTRLIAVDERSQRIIADHFRAAVFMIADGVRPSNTEAGYVLRRLLRRAVIKSTNKKINAGNISTLVNSIIDTYPTTLYPELSKSGEIKQIIEEELNRFSETLQNGLKEFKHIVETHSNGELFDRTLASYAVFTLYTSYGFPIELIEEMAKERGLDVDPVAFQRDMKKHQEISRAGSEQKFKGGLASTGEQETRLHTATHLMRQALEEVLGEKITQKGSNINAERLRFDFGFGRKMTDEEKKKVEDLVNKKISEKIPVCKVVMKKEEAEKTGAAHTFGEKYGDEVSIYYVGDTLPKAWSKEFCGGPHVKNTSELGHFKIAKEEASSAGVRRIKAILE